MNYLNQKLGKLVVDEIYHIIHQENLKEIHQEFVETFGEPRNLPIRGSCAYRPVLIIPMICEDDIHADWMVYNSRNMTHNFLETDKNIRNKKDGKKVAKLPHNYFFTSGMLSLFGYHHQLVHTGEVN